MTEFRRFYLNRVKDETGVSRTGRVLEGVVTQSGRVIVEWRPPHSSIGIYSCLEEFKTIHVDCHPSCSEIVWIDPLHNICPYCNTIMMWDGSEYYCDNFLTCPAIRKKSTI